MMEAFAEVDLLGEVVEEVVVEAFFIERGLGPLGPLTFFFFFCCGSSSVVVVAIGIEELRGVEGRRGREEVEARGRDPVMRFESLVLEGIDLDKSASSEAGTCSLTRSICVGL